MEWRTSRPAKRPGIIEPCIPTRVSKPPVGPQWIHEIEHDGYRLIARKRDGRVRLFTRRGFGLDRAISADQRGRGGAEGGIRDDRRRGSLLR
jgi:ATP-dependent DNA ligase